MISSFLAIAPLLTPVTEPPSVVLVLTDDQGYGDLSCYGHPTIRTPHIDALAAGGAKLTQFYVAAPLCSPSRAALLTGCYPKRVGMHRHMVFPPDDHGLHPDETTLAELLSAAGYATGCFGKWHLGHRAGLLPTDQGFDVFAGVPYSNDMAQFHRGPETKYAFRLPWMEGAEVVEWEPDQRELTRRQTDAVIAFIDSTLGEGGRPFFLYVPYSMPHIPIYASDAHAGTSRRGLYGDVIEEIDASVGRIVASLERHGALENTLLIFTSDNGPWLQYGRNGGSAGPLRGGKGTNYEGGQRVPCVLHWPARLAPGSVVRDVVTAMDVLPTLAAFAGVEPPERTIDGRDVSDLLTGGAAPPSQATFLYYASRGELAGIRRGPWKLLLEGPALYDVEVDVSEKHDVAASHPDMVEELRALAAKLDAEIERDARPEAHVEQEVFDPRRP
ncbi:MAG: sulfatase [Planctomycetota bacterium]